MASTPKTAEIDPIIFKLKDIVSGLVANDEKDLSSRQLAVFLHVYLENPDAGHTVRGLAATLNISKPAITRALDRLSDVQFDLVRRKVDPADRRSVLVQRTPKGAIFLRTLSRLALDEPAKRSTRKKAA